MVVVSPPAPLDIGRPGRPASMLQSPVFTFRRVEPGDAEIRLNGERVGALPLRWWVSEHTVFDPAIPVPAWPPEDAVPAARGRFRIDAGGWSEMEVYVRRGGAPVGDDGEVFYVRATWPGKTMQGALRVRVPGARWSSYVPTTLTEESPDAASQGRTLWFERD